MSYIYIYVLYIYYFLKIKLGYTITQRNPAHMKLNSLLLVCKSRGQQELGAMCTRSI